MHNHIIISIYTYHKKTYVHNIKTIYNRPYNPVPNIQDYTTGIIIIMKTMSLLCLQCEKSHVSYLSDAKQLTNNFTKLAKCSRQPKMTIGSINKLKRNLYTLRGLECRSLGSTSVAGGYCNQPAPLSGQVASLLGTTSAATLDDQTRKFDF